MMIEKLKKLTDGLIIFSALVSDYEQLDFKSDALAGVRANYFNSGSSAQSDKTEVVLDAKTYNLSYFMCKNEPLSWKITRNNRPYQSVKRAAGSVYCVIVYGENGIINKRIYFDDKHNWLRTEYYDNYTENVLQATIYPKSISGIIVIRIEQTNSDGIKTVKDLFPSSDMPKTKSSALIYSNAGMLWYDESHRPDNLEEYKIVAENNNIGFNFKTESFNFSKDKKDIFDLSNAEYLEDIKEEKTIIEITKDPIEIDADTYSAYDKIEKILSEAHKSNKTLFGEVINQVTNVNTADISSVESADSVSEIIEEDSIILDETIENNEVVSAESTADDSILVDDSDELIIESDDTCDKPSIENEVEIAVESENIISEIEETSVEAESIYESDEEITEEISDSNETINNATEFNKKDDDSIFEICEEKHCDVVIHTKTGRYSYYGSVDENNCRSGIGRTVTPDGKTSYEGEYKDDKRNGFGVCYYNEGNINYVGNWLDGNRSGCGVGYRLSDGTMHIGKWENNSPIDCGARFDSNGNFIDVSIYKDGQKNGKSISFDENGNIIIRKFRDGEMISERIIVDED